MGLSSSATLPPLLFFLTVSEFKSCNNVSSMQCTQYLYIVASRKVKYLSGLFLEHISKPMADKVLYRIKINNKMRRSNTVKADALKDQTSSHVSVQEIIIVQSCWSTRLSALTTPFFYHRDMFSDECFLSCSSAPCPWCQSASSPSLTATTCL